MINIYTFPYEVRLYVHRINAGQLVDLQLVLAPLGTLRTGLADPVEATHQGEPVPIEILGYPKELCLQFDSVPIGGPDPADIDVVIDAQPPAGTYYVGLVMADDHELEVHLRGVGNSVTWTHPIGRLPGDSP